MRLLRLAVLAGLIWLFPGASNRRPNDLASLGYGSKVGRTGSATLPTGAISPRPLFFRDPESIEEWVKQYYELRVFIEKIHPGADVLVTRIENPPTDPHWFKLPFLWKGMSVWVKMHHIYDQRRAA